MIVLVTFLTSVQSHRTIRIVHVRRGCSAASSMIRNECDTSARLTQAVQCVAVDRSNITRSELASLHFSHFLSLLYTSESSASQIKPVTLMCVTIYWLMTTPREASTVSSSRCHHCGRAVFRQKHVLISGATCPEVGNRMQKWWQGDRASVCCHTLYVYRTVLYARSLPAPGHSGDTHLLDVLWLCFVCSSDMI